MKILKKSLLIYIAFAPFGTTGQPLYLGKVFNFMKQIELTQGKFALVDDEDFEYLNQFSWYTEKRNKTFYARTVNDKRKKIYMHRFILGITNPKQLIDHVDLNGLNCQRNNLRLCTRSQNNTNRRSWGSSKYLGVCWDKSRSLWIASIKYGGRHYIIGRFANEIDAAKAYDARAIINHGEFANPNFK